MIRLGLRQLRAPLLVASVILALLGVVLAVTGLHLAQVNDAYESACTIIATCSSSANPIFADDPSLHVVLPLVSLVAPVVIGLFLGAPLIATELETGVMARRVGIGEDDLAVRPPADRDRLAVRP